MIPGPVEVSIADDDGAPHAYLISLHPAVDGQRVVMHLAGLLAGPLAGLVAASRGSVAGLLEADLGSLNLSGAAAQLGQALLSDAPPRLVRELLKLTVRDGKRLADDLVFNAAFTGNYGELLAALVEVVKVNHFLPLSRINNDPAKPTPT